MDAIKAILTRRSIRKYTSEPVSAEDETTILKAAMNAQNGVGQRGWEFIVVRDTQTMNTLSDCLRPNGEPLRHTPMAVVACGDMTKTIKNWEEYWVQDCSGAATNLLLAAHALGLGAVWYGTYPQTHKVEGVSRTLGLPEHIVPLCVIGLGHPAEEKPDLSEERYAIEKIHHEKW